MKSLEETRALMLAQLPAQPPHSARLPLSAALGRILAETVVSPVDVPPWDNSAVDGYAFQAAGVAPGELVLPVSQRIPAGRAPEPLLPGTAARIFTGACLPDGADTVLMQEDCREQDGQVHSSWRFQPADNVRRRGQDIAQGQPVLARGARLRPQEIGLLASVGCTDVTVQQLRVAIVSTGDELVEPGQPLGPAKIYNSNRFTLMGLLQSLGCEVIDGGAVADDPDALKARLLQLLPQADAVISSGGVSVGEEDHVREVMAQLGRIEQWKLAIKPGKPFAFGWLQQKPYFGLPGNPAAVLATFLLLVKPYLQAWMGCDASQVIPVPAHAGFSVRKPAKRQVYLMVRRIWRDGEVWLQSSSQQSSGVLSSACWADGWACIPPDTTVAEGDQVKFYPFSDLLC